MKQIDKIRLLEMIRIAVKTAGSQMAFAREAGISTQYLSDVLRGRRDPGEKILKWFGLEAIVFYRRTDGGKL